MRDEDKSKEELSAANSRYNDILSKMVFGLLTLDREWKFTYLNKVTQNILNSRSSEDLLGRVIWDILPNENPLFSENFKKSMCKQKHIRFEAFSYITDSWLEVDAYPSKDGITVLFRNIDNDKNAQEAIHLSEELFSTFFNLSPILMTLADIKTGKFIKVNKAFEVSCGYSSNEVIGKNSVELNLLPENNGQTLVDVFLDKGEIHNQEITIKTKSGQMRTGLFSTKIIKVNRTEFLLVVIKDITELKQYRKEVGRLNRLDLIGQMAAAISHEIRNPLTVVKGFLQMLTTKPKYLEDNEYFQLMISELDRANSIITDFLSVSRTNSSEFGEQNLNKIIKFVYPLINADALRSEKIISLELNPIPDLLLNKEEIKQLVLNLVRNGLEAMSAGGCLTISTLLKNEEVVLLVKDEGCGLPQKVLESLGTPFITTKENGTGLGLAVCSGIVSRHKGKIDVETGSKGTIFSVKFPVSNTHLTYISFSNFSEVRSLKLEREHSVLSG